MEKQRPATHKKGPGLSSLFWGYLLSTLSLLALLFLVWFFMFHFLLNDQVLLPANTAALHLTETADALQAEPEFSSEKVPFYYRWAVIDRTNTVLDHNMRPRQLSYALRALQGDSVFLGFPYQQFHYFVPLQNDTLCILQYDYSVYYTNPALQQRLPEFQTCYLILLVLLSLGICFVQTRLFTRMLRRDAAAINLACDAVRRRCLDEPLPRNVRVKELQTALNTIDTLRSELAQSLKEQWAAEQQKNEALAALTHDLKTPLTVISGNAELLCEDNLSDAQHQNAEAILRSTRHAEHYVQRLRAITAGKAVATARQSVSPAAFAAECAALGQDLCAPVSVCFSLCLSPDPLPEQPILLEQESLLRAVENLLSNAVRYTPTGGRICLSVLLDAEFFTLCVQDSGPGFSAEALAKAGRTFYTEHQNRPQDGHLGMGLYLASETAKQHGGTLVLCNTAEGAQACLRLPV